MAFQKVPSKLEEYCRWFNDSLASIDASDAAAVYRFSFAAHFRLVTIHPWVDGNGRVTRLIMNALQHRFGLPMSRILKSSKAQYIQALIDARENEDEEIFVNRAMEMLAADLEEQLQRYTKDTSVTDNVTDNVTDTQKRILEVLEGNPSISQSQLAEMIGIHRVNVNRNIRLLVDRGILERVGSVRKGHWKILKRCDRS